MCGIVAVLTRDPDFSLNLLEKMRDRLAHRGPDGFGSWMERHGDGSAVGLGHRRLSIIDLRVVANQPMASADGRYQIIFNGEIYNYVELREELRQAGVPFRTDSDTEVLLAAYERWGSGLLGKLNGMFAFAIWDRSERTLFVARDRFGEKPLYYGHMPGGGIALASEVKALLAYPQMAGGADFEQVERLLRGGSMLGHGRTMFRGISEFPAATAAVFGANGQELRRWRYWTPDYTAVRKNTKPADAIAEFRERLQKSLLQRLRSDVKFGACLSGGLDSSTLVGMLARMRSERGIRLQDTYSARFDDDPTISEGTYIDRVIQYTGLTPHAVSPTAGEFVADARSLYWHQEIPFLSPSIYLEWRVLKFAKSMGTTVMIDGQGADELLGGYSHFFEARQMDLVSQGRFFSLARETSAANRRLDSVRNRYVASERRFSNRVGLSYGDIFNRVKGEWRGRLSQVVRGRQKSVDTRPGIPQGEGRFRQWLAGGILYDMLPNQLHSADRSAMAFGVETRFPFLDYELVDWAIGLPNDIMFADGWQKHVLRSAAEGFIPDDVRWRPDKVGFAAPTDLWMRAGMKDWMADRLFQRSLADVPGYDRSKTEQMWADHLSEAADYSWPLYRIASIGEWLAMDDEGIWSSAQKPAIAAAG